MRAEQMESNDKGLVEAEKCTTGVTVKILNYWHCLGFWLERSGSARCHSLVTDHREVSVWHRH